MDKIGTIEKGGVMALPLPQLQSLLTTACSPPIFAQTQVANLDSWLNQIRESYSSAYSAELTALSLDQRTAGWFISVAFSNGTTVYGSAQKP